MRFLEKFSRGELRLNRIEALSDGVFAIIVTILVLELKVPALPHPADSAALADALLGLWPKFFGWLVSFVIVCKFWLNHHQVLALARHADYGLVWINAVFLMFQSFVPFPAAVMGEYPANPLAVSFFGIVMALNTALFVALHAYILARLARPEALPTVPPRIIAKSFVGVAGYLLGAGAAWMDVRVAFVAYVATPLFFLVPPSRQLPARSPAPGPSSPAGSGR